VSASSIGRSGSRGSELVRLVAACWLAFVVLVGLGAPVLVGERPLLVRTGQTGWDAPLVTGTPRAPDDSTWHAWWVSLPADTDAFALVPPWPVDPLRVATAPPRARPSADHPLGVDSSGRDQLARVVHGARTAVFVAAIATALAGGIGVVLGLLAGLLGGTVDWLLSRILEATAALPGILIALAAAALLGPSRHGPVLVIALLAWPGFARVVRGQVLALRRAPFLEAARMRGIGTLPLLYRHVLPVVRGQIAVTAAFVASAAIAIEAALTFLGCGSVERVSWGGMLADGRAYAHTGAWHLWVVPGLALGLSAASLHVLADRFTSRAARPSAAWTP
jgi:peptide/nickel transport system permease protein